jgi:hypothetical protein
MIILTKKEQEINFSIGIICYGILFFYLYLSKFLILKHESPIKTKLIYSIISLLVLFSYLILPLLSTNQLQDMDLMTIPNWTFFSYIMTTFLFVTNMVVAFYLKDRYSVWKGGDNNEKFYLIINSGLGKFIKHYNELPVFRYILQFIIYILLNVVLMTPTMLNTAIGIRVLYLFNVSAILYAIFPKHSIWKARATGALASATEGTEGTVASCAFNHIEMPKIITNKLVKIEENEENKKNKLLMIPIIALIVVINLFNLIVMPVENMVIMIIFYVIIALVSVGYMLI